MNRVMSIVLLLVLAAGPLRAQTLTSEYEEAHPAGMALGGLLLGAGGLLAGGYLGLESGIGEKKEWFGGGWGAYYVGSAVGAVTLGYGVHALNRRRGDGAKVVLASLLVGAAGVALTTATESAVPLVLTVPVQLGVALAVERSTARANFEASRPNIGLWRSQEGAPGLALSMTF